MFFLFYQIDFDYSPQRVLNRINKPFVLLFKPDVCFIRREGANSPGDFTRIFFWNRKPCDNRLFRKGKRTSISIIKRQLKRKSSHGSRFTFSIQSINNQEYLGQPVLSTHWKFIFSSIILILLLWKTINFFHEDLVQYMSSCIKSKIDNLMLPKRVVSIPDLAPFIVCFLKRLDFYLSASSNQRKKKKSQFLCGFLFARAFFFFSEQ